MSDTIPMNDVPESNGTIEQPAYNGETEEHAGKLIYCIQPKNELRLTQSVIYLTSRFTEKFL